jgi:hypothetical protein
VDARVFDVGDLLVAEVVEHHQDLFGVGCDGTALVEMTTFFSVCEDFRLLISQPVKTARLCLGC